MLNLALGVLVGLPLGYVLQRTRLCFNSAYRIALLQKDYTLLRMIALAIIIQMVALYTLVEFRVGGLTLNVVPFYILACTLGGFAFGLAMVYAEGCSSTVWYRLGNGNLGALATLFGFALGEWLMLAFDPFAFLRVPEMTTPLGVATLPNFVGLSPWLFIIPITLASVFWLRSGRVSSYLGGWNWRIGGLVLGLIGSAAWLAAWPTGWHYGVGIVGATSAWIKTTYQGVGALNWGSWMVAALPIGALMAALRHNEFKWQLPSPSSAARLMLAGSLMGASAAFAGGCNIGHGFTGLPTLALSSITATLFTILGAAVANYWRFKRPERLPLQIPSA